MQNIEKGFDLTDVWAPGVELLVETRARSPNMGVWGKAPKAERLSRFYIFWQ